MNGERFEHVRPPAGSPDDPAVRAARRLQEPLKPVAPVAPIVTFVSPDERQVVVPLRHPVVIDGATRTHVAVRRLTGRELYDLVMADGEEAALGRRVRAAMTGLPVGAIDGLDADDTRAVLDAIEPFLPAVIRSLAGATADEPGEAPATAADPD